MKKTILTASLCSLLIAGSVQADSTDDEMKKNHSVIPGHVSHGINVYNNKAIIDYSAVSPSIPYLNPADPVREIGAFLPGAADAEIITEATDRSRKLATTRKFVDFFNPLGEVDPDLFNKTLDNTGVNFFGYTKVTDRIVPTLFDSAQAGALYRAKETNTSPTVGEWDKASGQIIEKCRDDGTATLKVTIRDALPNSLFTLWEVGAIKPLTQEEAGYAIPLGGLPNVMTTSNEGCAYKEIEMPYCVTRACEAGSNSCTNYVSAFYHWDAQVYGGSPAATFAGAPIGAYAANQVIWGTTGEALIEPQNKFSPKRPGCNIGEIER